jgi:uncharacterized membrane protein
LSTLDKVACFITDHVGTMGFFLIIFCWTVFWLGWNLLMPQSMRFDPGMSFVFYLFISNVIQILLMPLIMVGQNVQGRASDRRAENDLEINIKAEKEIETILEHLEYQNNILLDIVKKVDTTLADAIARRHAETVATREAIVALAGKFGEPTPPSVAVLAADADADDAAATKAKAKVEPKV